MLTFYVVRQLLVEDELALTSTAHVNFTRVVLLISVDVVFGQKRIPRPSL
jgi:hypothetical protein